MGASTLAHNGVLFLDRYEAFADLGLTPDTGTRPSAYSDSPTALRACARLL